VAIVKSTSSVWLKKYSQMVALTQTLSTYLVEVPELLSANIEITMANKAQIIHAITLIAVFLICF
jgi:hypothetical protein